MRPRHAVLLTIPEADPRRPPATPLESTPIGMLQVLILNNLNLFRINTFSGLPRFAQFWCSASPLDATLASALACVANKGFREIVSPLNATLTENRGGVARLWLTSSRPVSPIRSSNIRTRRCFSSHFIHSCRSLHKECLRTLVKSEASALSLKTAGCTPTIPNLELAPFTRHESPACSDRVGPSQRYPLPASPSALRVWLLTSHQSRVTSHQSRVPTPLSPTGQTATPSSMYILPVLSCPFCIRGTAHSSRLGGHHE
jgi:hypothetical protein